MCVCVCVGGGGLVDWGWVGGNINISVYFCSNLCVQSEDASVLAIVISVS